MTENQDYKTPENEEINIEKNAAVESDIPFVQNSITPKTEQAKSNKLLRLSLVLNGIALAGLVGMAIWISSSKNNTHNSTNNAVLKSNSSNLSVAFVNNDSILSNYDLVKKMRSELESKTKRLESEIASKQHSFEKDAAYFQEQVQKKTISEQSAQEIYGQLMQQQQKIYELRDRYAAELQKEELDMNISLLDSVMNFLGRYNTKYNFDYILGFTKGGNILFANDTLDITKNVLEELNTEYRSKHKSK